MELILGNNTGKLTMTGVQKRRVAGIWPLLRQDGERKGVIQQDDNPGKAGRIDMRCKQSSSP